MRACLRTLALCLVLVGPAFAHHGGAVEYNMDQTRGPVTGTVVTFVFTFPHPYIEFEVKGPNGAEKWAAVLQPTPTNLRALGWTRESLKAGDTLTVSGPPHKTAPNMVLGRQIEVNGKMLKLGE